MNMVLRYTGAKWRIANWIISHMPSHHSYLEPFFGSGAIFFSKQPSKIETINDLDGNVTNLFEIIRTNAEELAHLVYDTPFSRKDYDDAFNIKPTTSFEKARLFLLKCWQGYGFRTNDSKVGWKRDISGRDAAYALRNWNRLPKWILDIQDRLKTVQIENRPALEVIETFNKPNVLIYCDPPYVLSTRTGKQYKYEMTESDHAALLKALLAHRGMIMISGYDSELYNNLLSGWAKYAISTTAEKGVHRTEYLWTNYAGSTLFKEA